MSLTNPAYWVTKQLPSSPTWSRSENGSELNYEYLISGPDDPYVVMATANYRTSPVPAHGSSHPMFSFLRVQDVQVSPTKMANPFCKMTIRYAEMLNMTPDWENWEWDIGSSQQRITSVAGPGYVWHFPPADDYGLGINVKGDDVEGVDVYRGATTMRVTKIWSSISASGRMMLFNMTPSMNNDWFFEYAPGECLFLGAQINRTPGGLVSVTYNFICAPDLGGYYVWMMNYGYILLAPYPFDYVWFVPAKTLATGWDGAQIPYTGIRSAHICEVYNWSFFSNFMLQGPYG